VAEYDVSTEHGYPWRGRVTQDNINNVPPSHPGAIVSVWMENKKLTADELAASAEIPSPKLKLILKGNAPVDKTVAVHLGKVFPSTAELLYRMQFEYDFFREHGTRPAREQVPFL
jgi:addiction module HigA family antidote